MEQKVMELLLLTAKVSRNFCSRELSCHGTSALNHTQLPNQSISSADNFISQKSTIELKHTSTQTQTDSLSHNHAYVQRP